MVSRSLLKATLRTIRRSAGRFLALLTIVALGVGFLAGLMASSPDMRYSVQLYYADTGFMDLRILGNLGLTAGDAAAINALPQVERVMPAHSRDLLASTPEGDTLAVRVHSADFSEDAINRGVLLEGRWPEGPGECVVESEMGLLSRLGVGGSLTFTSENKDLDDFLARREFTITGVVASSYYLNMSQRGNTSVGSGRLGGIVYLPLESFSADYYTEIFVTLSGGTDLPLFSDEYTALADAGADAVETLAETQKYVRRDEIRGEAEAELADAQQKLDEEAAKAERELADALLELEDGEAQLSDAEQKLADGQAEYDDGVAELAGARRDFERQLSENRKKLDDGAAAIAEAFDELDAGFSALFAGDAELSAREAEWAAANDELVAAETELFAADAELSAGETAFEAAVLELAAQREALEAQADTPFARTEQYAQALAALEAGEAQMEAQAAVLRQSRLELDAGLAQVREARAALDEGGAMLEAARAEIEQNRAVLDEGAARLEAELAALGEARAQLDAGEVAARREFSAAQRKLDSAKTELEEGYAEVAENRVKLDDGWVEYYKGEKEARDALEDAQDKITEARDKIRDIEEPKWYVLTRETNAGYVTYDGDSGKIAAIARVFPIFFFLVAVLVASTTMTRMVDEERAVIGALKALGYGNAPIAMKYFLYAGTAAALGCAAGLALGLNLFPNIIYNAYSMMYSLPPKVAAAHFTYGALASGAIFGAIMLATAGALAGTLRECAASLMRPKAPKEGKRIFLERVTPVWRRMKFTHKVTARNLLRYKKRFFMTVTGVFGCTALILCGFGLRDSISDIVGVQYGELFTYSFTAALSHTGDERTDRRIRAVLEDSGDVFGCIAVSQQNVTARAGGKSLELTLTVPENASDLTGYITLRERVGKNDVELGEQSVLLTEKAAATLGLDTGDTFEMENSDGQVHSFTLSGIVENYISGHIYMPAAVYSSAYGAPPEYLTLLAHSRDESAEIRDDISERLLASPNVTSVNFVAGISEGFGEMLDTIDYIIVVITISAGILAFVVMYNLTNINIAEREKELATVRVLGFTSLETAMYIFRETIILSLVGASTGLVGGIFLHRFIIGTVEVDNMMFGRVIKPESFIVSFVVTLVFSVLVSFAMGLKMRRISMAESLKAPE